MGNIKIPDWKRAVIKVGSSQVAPDGKGCSTKYALAIANFIIQSHHADKEIILVSSGAVAAGLGAYPDQINNRTKAIPEKQALAAIGQTLLMQHWSKFFDFPCAQVLLTLEGLNNRESYVNVKNTINELLRLKALPIVNENDSVGTEELKVGDNDNLAAHVAVLSEADLLIICTDIDGLYDSDPTTNKDAKIIQEIDKIDDSIYRLAGASNNPFATGGMYTKIQAAEKATSRGIDTLIINGKKEESFELLKKGKLSGTIIKKLNNPVAAKKHWLLHTIKNSGKIKVDEGAKNAIVKKGASLLPSGIIGVSGKFKAGEAVTIIFGKDNDEQNIAKGITLYSAQELEKIKGKKSKEIIDIIGYYADNEVIHRDDMVLVEN
jgi:glutamate 5-kinase